MLKRLLPLISITLIIAWIINVIANQILPELHPFGGTYANGVFQIFNPLRRIDAGQIMGQDFFFFHGVLIPYTIYPLFKAFGGDFFASELSRQISPFILYIPIIIFFFLKIFKDNTHRYLALVTYILLFAHQKLYRGYHSLLSLRSIPPLLVFTLFLCKPSKRIYLLRGLALAWACWNSTEQGLACLIATLLYFAALSLMFLLKHREDLLKAITANITTFILNTMSLFTGFSIFSLICIKVLKLDGESLSKILKFNYLSVPGDQFWYFGAPPVPYFVNFLSIFKTNVGRELILLWVLLSILLLMGLYLAYKYWDRAELRLKFLTIFAMGLYAGASTISTFAIAHPIYLKVAKRILILIGFIYISSLKYLDIKTLFISIKNNCINLFQNLNQNTKIIKSIFVIFLLFLPIFGIVKNSMLISTYLSNGPSLYDASLEDPPKHLRKKNRRHQVSWLEWQSEVKDDILSLKPNFIWSTYTSMAEYIAGTHNPHTDYIIHALGNKSRQEYLDTFKATKPDIVQTFKRSFFAWEEWLQTTTWSFWEELVLNYKPIKSLHQSIFWQNQDSKGSGVYYEASQNIQLHDSKNQFTISHKSSKTGIYVVDFDYEITEKIHIPFFGKSTRFLVSIFNSGNTYPVSLNPQNTHVQFPVYLYARQIKQIREEKTPIDIEVQVGKVGIISNLHNIKIHNVKYRWLNLPDSSFIALSYMQPDIELKDIKPLNIDGYIRSRELSLLRKEQKKIRYRRTNKNKPTYMHRFYKQITSQNTLNY